MKLHEGVDEDEDEDEDENDERIWKDVKGLRQWKSPDVMYHTYFSRLFPGRKQSKKVLRRETEMATSSLLI